MTNLEQCPFCGGEAKIYEGLYSEDGRRDEPWAVTCQGCGARIVVMPEYGERNYWWRNLDEGVKHMREVVANKWNARHKRTCKNVDMVPKDGSGFYQTPHFECSECGASYALTSYAYYCPSCGAEVIE